MPIELTITLRSLEDYVIAKHGGWRQLDVPEIRVIQRGMRDIVETIADSWPVDTGYSRDRWTFTTELNRPGYKAVIENDAGYSQWVHRHGGDPEEPLWEELVPDILAQMLPPILAAARREVDKTESRLRAGQAPQTRGLLARPRVSGAAAGRA